MPDNEELRDGAHAGGDAGAADAGAADEAGAETANRPHNEACEDPAEAARKRKRCVACYQGAGNRRLGQKAPKVTTRCGQCEKAFCLPHLHLYCDDCDVGGAAAPRPRLPRLPQLPPPQEPLEQTVERKSLEIAQMRQQIAAMMNLVSSISKMLIFGTSCNVFNPLSIQKSFMMDDELVSWIRIQILYRQSGFRIRIHFMRIRIQCLK